MTGPSATSGKRIRGLQANALAAVVMLLLQYSLGMYVDLYSTLPASDSGKAIFPGFAAAVAKGPVVLSLHAILGTLLLISASAAVIRSVRAAVTAPIALTVLGLLAVLAAWLSGSIFIGNQSNGHSIAMALATAVALLSYVLVLFLLNSRSEDESALDSTAGSFQAGEKSCGPSGLQGSISLRSQEIDPLSYKKGIVGNRWQLVANLLFTINFRTVAVRCEGLRIRLFSPFWTLPDLRPVATGCARLAP